METLQDKINDLQWMIISRFRGIIGNPQENGYKHRYLKAGVFKRKPVSIYEPDLAGLRRSAVISSDEIAHFLTASEQDYSGTVNHIIVYPIIEITEEKILTHVYDSSEKILVFYLYPKDWNTAQKSVFPDRFSHLPADLTPGLTDIILQTVSKVSPGSDDQPVFFTSELFTMNDEEYTKLTQVSEEFQKTQTLYI